MIAALGVVVAALVVLWVWCACRLNGRITRREEAEELRREMHQWTSQN